MRTTAEKSGQRSTDPRPGDLLTSANLASLSRLPLAVAFFVSDSAGLRVAILIAAAATDYLDGWLARRFDQASSTGELLDPITDKVFVVTALAAFVRTGTLAAWELLVLLGRDLLTVIAFPVAKVFHLPVRFRARMSGKVATTLQIATLLVITVIPQLTRHAVLITGAAGAWAIADYTRAGVNSLRSSTRVG